MWPCLFPSSLSSRNQESQGIRKIWRYTFMSSIWESKCNFDILMILFLHTLHYFSTSLDNTWKGKYQSTDNTKCRKRKRKLLPKKWRDLWTKGTQKAWLKWFDNHRCLLQSEESKCMWTHGKGGTMWEFWKIVLQFVLTPSEKIKYRAFSQQCDFDQL